MVMLQFCLLLLIGLKSGIALNDREASYKWSPQYFNRPLAQALRGNSYDYTPKYSYYGGNSRDFAQMRALPAMTTGIRRVKGSFASWSPQWNKMSSLGNKRIVSKKSSMCSRVGEACYVSSFLSKLGSPCCPGTSCSLVEEGTYACLENTGSLDLYLPKGHQYEGLEDPYDYLDE